MDFSQLSLPHWASLAALAEAPDVLVAALVSALATLGLLLGFAPRLLGRARPAPEVSAEGCDYLIHGGSLKPLTAPARALIDGLEPTGSRLAALAEHLAVDCPSIEEDLEALVLYGTGFRHHCRRADGGAIEIVGAPRGAGAFLSVRPATAEARALKDAEAALGQAREEAGFLRDVIDRAPILAWSLGPDGQVAWASAPYRDRFDAPAGELPDHRISDGFGHVLEEVPLTARGAGSRRRVSVPCRQNGEAEWFELTQVPGAAGETLGYALAADDLVAAEASLRRFVETLTETFAHLPIGLAVFDKNRRLGLFNPALTDLVKIDAVWLAGRPSLRDFLERLRETRQMPEQKDFTAWRRKLSELEESARDGTYEENWQLASGKIFRVTGRPHPQGALAFLFEDISTAVMLERKYRSELELSQATLDRVSDAVAVFNASGMLVFVNSAFESMWGLDPMARLDGPGVGELTRLWAKRCAPSPVWAQLAEFATAAEARTSWAAPVETLEGRRLDVRVAPLPDASALVVFRDRPAEPAAARPPPAGDGLLGDLALEQMRLPVEAAVARLAAAIPAAPSPEAFEALSLAAQDLKDGLARAGELQELARAGGAATASGPLPALAAALAVRKLALEVPAAAADWAPELRRTAFALGLALADLAAPGTAVTLTLEDASGLRRLTASAAVRSDSGRDEGVGIALARRMVEAARGSLRHGQEGGRATLTADLPPALPVRAAIGA